MRTMLVFPLMFIACGFYTSKMYTRLAMILSILNFT
jgi:hypothetical protein